MVTPFSARATKVKRKLVSINWTRTMWMVVGEAIEIQARHLHSGSRRKGNGRFYRMNCRWVDRLEVKEE